MADRGSVNVCNLEKQRCSQLLRGEEGTYTGAIAVDPKSRYLIFLTFISFHVNVGCRTNSLIF